jgi:glycosyltransferase involved in cell wall biosynthesis
VHFLGTRSDIPELLSLLDVSVLTSHMEASPVSILESMACGKPVVAPRVGSIPEVVVDGQTGYLASPGDAAELAGRIIHLLNCPAEAHRLGMAGRQRVLDGYSLDRMVDGYQQLIAQIYSNKCGTREPSPALSAV